MNVFVGNDSPVGGVGPTQYSVSPTPLVAVCVARLFCVSIRWGSGHCCIGEDSANRTKLAD